MTTHGDAPLFSQVELDVLELNRRYYSGEDVYDECGLMFDKLARAVELGEISRSAQHRLEEFLIDIREAVES